MERKLASIQRIIDIQPIVGADKIVCTYVNGWKVVTAIDNSFKVDDLVVYIEIDSWVPHELAPFLSKGHEPREFEGVKGERLRTIKLRGQLSQGLIMPIPKDIGDVEIGLDVTDKLGVKKWDKPLSANLSGLARGNFPSFIQKTDQERCQNIPQLIIDCFASREVFEVTEKLDGSSMTIYRNGDITGVCSRNLDLKIEQDGNAFVNKAKHSGLIDVLNKYGKNIAVQGELYGAGIQGNNEKVVGTHFAVFDIFDIDSNSYLLPIERYQVLSELIDLGADVEHINVLHSSFELPSNDLNDLLDFAKGKNAVGSEREGVVFKSTTRSFSFKAISNSFLLCET